MFHYLTKNLKNENGMAIIIVIPILLMITILGITAIYNANTDMDISGSVKRGSQAFYIAEAGLERAVNEYIWGNFFDENVSPISNPFGWLEGLGDSAFYSSIPLGDNGSYSTRVTSVVNPGSQSPYIDCRDVTIEAIGKANAGSESTTLTATMRFGILPSGVFDYSYFINHFGWWAGFPSGYAVANGNVRANGHFDLLSGHLTVNGNPRFDPITGEVVDGGGVFAGGFVYPTSGAGYHGMAADSVNRHSYAGVDRNESDRAFVDMPNLNDAADLDGDGNVAELNPYYIDLSNGVFSGTPGRVGIDLNGNGTLQPGEVIVTGTYGDNVGETGHLALAGTAANPIIIDGTVAVTGNLAIKGTIQGQGSFYTGRNTYVGGGVYYKNPTTARPTYNYGSETPEQYRTRVEAWNTANQHADLVSFMTVNNIIAGDHTSSSWRNYIIGGSGWLDDYRNNGFEDVGVDGAFGNMEDRNNPYSASDREADGLFTVIIADANGHQHQADLPISGGVAQVPAGYHIVPGTGEDVDGDGRYGNPYNYNDDLNFDAAFNSTNFYNLSASVASYSDFSSFSVSRMDGVFYTNHALAGWFDDYCQFNGSIVARNESMILRGPHLTMNHDERLASGYQDLAAMNIHMPLTKSFSTVSWEDKSVR